MGTVLFTKLYAAYGPTISTVVLTLVVLIFGEISPKSLAKEHAEGFAMFSAPILRVFLLILRPLNFLFSQWKKLLNLIFRPSEDPGITEEELITMVSEAENEGGLDQHESQLIRSAIEFGDLEAGDILTPRVDIVAVEDSATMEEIAATFAESGYSRLPVYHKDVDDIVGVIHEKDFNAARYHGQSSISGCITPVHYTTANAELGLLLRTLQKKKTHMAIVVDEYGGTEGLLTMEDILEELVGEIWDEHDEVVESFRKQADGCYLVAAGARPHRPLRPVRRQGRLRCQHGLRLGHRPAGPSAPGGGPLPGGGAGRHRHQGGPPPGAGGPGGPWRRSRRTPRRAPPAERRHAKDPPVPRLAGGAGGLSSTEEVPCTSTPWDSGSCSSSATASAADLGVLLRLRPEAPMGQPGFLRGPLLPIYGTGAVIILLAVIPVRENPALVFLLGMLAATALEYVTGAAK